MNYQDVKNKMTLQVNNRWSILFGFRKYYFLSSGGDPCRSYDPRGPVPGPAGPEAPRGFTEDLDLGQDLSTWGPFGAAPRFRTPQWWRSSFIILTETSRPTSGPQTPPPPPPPPRSGGEWTMVDSDVFRYARQLGNKEPRDVLIRSDLQTRTGEDGLSTGIRFLGTRTQGGPLQNLLDDLNKSLTQDQEVPWGTWTSRDGGLLRRIQENQNVSQSVLVWELEDEIHLIGPPRQLGAEAKAAGKTRRPIRSQRAGGEAARWVRCYVLLVSLLHLVQVDLRGLMSLPVLTWDDQNIRDRKRWKGRKHVNGATNYQPLKWKNMHSPPITCSKIIIINKTIKVLVDEKSLIKTLLRYQTNSTLAQY